MEILHFLCSELTDQKFIEKFVSYPFARINLEKNIVSNVSVNTFHLLCKKCPHLNLFWSVISSIWTEYGDS